MKLYSDIDTARAPALISPFFFVHLMWSVVASAVTLRFMPPYLSLLLYILVHTAYEVISDLIIKSKENSIPNSVGDTIGALVGWYIGYMLHKNGLRNLDIFVLFVLSVIVQNTMVEPAS